MKIFVGFGYHERDQWVKNLIFPLIESFDGEVITGEEIFGEVLAEGVKAQIRESNVVFAILTRRDELRNGNFTTSQWVTTEYQYAVDHGIKAIAFVESKVDWNPGISGDRQMVPFDETGKDQLLVTISRILSQSKKRYGTRRLRLNAADDVIDEIRPLINKGLVTCTYRYMIDNTELDEVKAPLLRLQGGIYIGISNVPPYNGFLQVKVTTNQTTCTSEYVSLESLSIINLSKE